MDCRLKGARSVVMLMGWAAMPGGVGLSGAATSGATPHGAAHATDAAGACALITRAEAASALGAPVPAGAERTMNLLMAGRPVKADYCFYGSEVVVVHYDLGTDAASVFSQYERSLASHDDYQAVAGVGDDAFIAKGQLAVRKGQTGLIVDVGQARGGDARELNAEKSLALLALGRL